jgi:hypothetical protein
MMDHQSRGLKYNNYEQHRLDTTYYNLVTRYNLKNTPGYMFRPSLGHPQANTNIIKIQKWTPWDPISFIFWSNFFGETLTVKINVSATLQYFGSKLKKVEN